MKRRYWMPATAAACAVLAAIWLLPRPKPAPPPAASEYVNPALCAACHQEIARTYRLTGMGRSFSRPRPGNVVEDYQLHNTLNHHASDRTYTMLARDGRWFERRHQTGVDGAETNIFEASIDYIIGSGDHARSYLHRTGEGKLVELPVTWYSEKGGYWAMSPGYDRPDHSDFRRAISFECMSCHNGYPAAATGRGVDFRLRPARRNRLPAMSRSRRCAHQTSVFRRDPGRDSTGHRQSEAPQPGPPTRRLHAMSPSDHQPSFAGFDPTL